MDETMNYELRMTNYDGRMVKIIFVFVLLLGSAFTVAAQSTNQSFPTAITSNEISGRIPARDVGDARLTAYFYVFNGGQGDVFINVVTKNLNGDIDVFTADNLRPLTKITVYADAGDGETGRVIYLRQPAKLILRVEGRTPNDDAATFQIKFAGSFVAANAADSTEVETPVVKSDNQTDVRVNSVGTIIEIKPKPTPAPKEVIAETKPEKPSKRKTKSSDAKTEKEAEKSETVAEEKSEEKPEETKPTVIVTDELNETEQAETETKKEDQPAEVVEPKKSETVAEEKTEPKVEPKKPAKPKSVKPVPPAELGNIRLLIQFKDGTKVERPMSEVLKVGVDKGILTVIFKDGTIGRYSILDVEKMTIE